MAISAGPLFTLNPSISFFVQIEPADEVDRLWSELVKGGQVMMPLDNYPWSERYGWLKNRYGVSWQVAPRLLGEMVNKGTREQVDRVTQTFLPMKKLDIAAIQKAFEGQ